MRSPTDSLTQPIVQIFPELHRKALMLCNLPHLDLETRSQIYCNCIALEMTLDWFQDEIVTPALFHHDWQKVNGSAILLPPSQKRTVIIPSDVINSTEMVVSDYWVKTSQYCGDYFLCIQIDPNEQWLKFCGYTSCKNLRQSHYDQKMNTYTIALQALIQDIAVFGVVNSISFDEETR